MKRSSVGIKLQIIEYQIFDFEGFSAPDCGREKKMEDLRGTGRYLGRKPEGRFREDRTPYFMGEDLKWKMSEIEDHLLKNLLKTRLNKKINFI